jgi:hypothetical protein
MAHFAKVVDGIVTQVNVIDEDYFNSNRETRYTGTWVQTSYNTRGGVHYNPETNEPSADQTKALRKNYAGVGYFYDETKDAFYAPQPFPSWLLNETSCLWEAPIPYPNDNKRYEWNESTQEWIESTL